MFLLRKPILHMTDMATHFSAVSFLRSQSAEEIWCNIRSPCSLLYFNHPDHSTLDQGTSSVNQEMSTHIEATRVTLNVAEVQNLGTIGAVERYHTPLHTALDKIFTAFGRNTTDLHCLHLSVHTFNATIRPKGLCPMLLNFGALPRPACKAAWKTKMYRAQAIQHGIVAAEKEQTKRRIAFRLKHTRWSKRRESLALLR